MGRLIDADSFAENLIHCSGLGRKSFELVLNALNAQPTAYDVEKVVGELESRKDLMNLANIPPTHRNVGQNAYNMAIDIVRKGGVE